MSSDEAPKNKAAFVKGVIKKIGDDTNVVNLLSKADWKKMKADAGIKSKKGLLKSHASVGSKLDKFHTARTKWQKVPGKKNFASYLGKVDNLIKALEDFQKSKDLEKNDETKKLNAKIKGWLSQLKVQKKKLAGVAASKKRLQILEAVDKKDMGAILDITGTTGK